MKVVQDQFLLLLVDFFHFSKNHIAFTLDGSLFQLAVEQNIRQNLDGTSHIVLENLGKVDGLFTRCVGVPGVEAGELFWVSLAFEARDVSL